MLVQKKENKRNIKVKKSKHKTGVRDYSLSCRGGNYSHPRHVSLAISPLYIPNVPPYQLA